MLVKTTLAMILFLSLIVLICASGLSESETQTLPDRVAVYIRGEAFRSGGQHSRNTGLPESLPDQQLAVQTQIEYVIEPLKSKLGASKVDVFVETYSTPFDVTLDSWYGPYLNSTAPQLCDVSRKLVRIYCRPKEIAQARNVNDVSTGESELI